METQCLAIGETAGKIYRSLETEGTKTTDALVKEVDVNDAALFHQALGWLAREGKIGFEKKGSLLRISLMGVATCCH